jgi:hypothetical protein
MQITLFTVLGLSASVVLFMIDFAILMAMVFPLDTAPGEA